MAEPKNTGVDQGPAGLGGQLAAEPAVGEGRLVVQVGGHQRFVVVAEQVGQPGGEPVVGPGAVELVHEQQRGEAQPLQGAHEHAGLGLHPDEVGVAGRVDQVDGRVTDHERHHRRLDGDAALALKGSESVWVLAASTYMSSQRTTRAAIRGRTKGDPEQDDGVELRAADRQG
jgi:hypothetical protein